MMRFVHQPSRSDRLGDYLEDGLSRSWIHFRAAVAFVKRSGIRHVAPALADFARAGHVEIIAGIDHGGTSIEGLQELLAAVSPRGRVIVFHNRLAFTFHPKIYLFKSSAFADVMIGSGNLTEGGLFTNYEAGVRLSLDLGDATQAAFLQSVEDVLDRWADLSTGTARVLDEALLARLAALGLVPAEASADSRSKGVAPDDGETGSVLPDSPFSVSVVPRAPPFPASTNARRTHPEDAETATAAVPGPRTPAPRVRGFVMTLQRTDVGVGQATAGAARRSPEIFIPLVARDAEPEFWGWPDRFEPGSRPALPAPPARSAHAVSGQDDTRDHDAMASQARLPIAQRGAAQRRRHR